MRIAINLLFFIVLFCSCNENHSSSIGESLNYADSLNAVITANPKNSDALLERAKYFESIGEIDSALVDINKKMALSIKNEDYYLKGNLLYQSSDFENAEKSYRLCVENDSENAKCYLKLAQIKQLLGYFNTAISLVDSALYQDKTLSEAYFLKGFTFELRQMVGDSTKAITSYQTCVELDPKFYEAYIRLGLLHAKQNDSLALQYYQTAIDLEPGRIEAYYNKAIYCQNTERYDLAMTLYDQMLEIDDKSFLAYYNQGYLLSVYADEFQEAKEKFDKAINYKNDYKEAYYNRALCLMQLNQIPAARLDCSKALELDPVFDKAALLLSEMDRIKN